MIFIARAMPPFQGDKTISGKEIEVFNDQALKPKKKYPGFGQNLCDYFSEYSGASSIHGIKYLGEQKRTIIEK